MAKGPGERSVSNVMLARAQAAHNGHLEDLLSEIDTAMALRGMEHVGVYFGVPCPKCRVDVLPLPDGTCGWCNTLVADCE